MLVNDNITNIIKEIFSSSQIFLERHKYRKKLKVESFLGVWEMRYELCAEVGNQIIFICDIFFKI